MATKPGGGRVTGGAKKTNKLSPKQRQSELHNAGRTLFHNEMKQNAENKLGNATESIANLSARYQRDDKNVRDRAVKDAAAIRKNRNAQAKARSGGSGSRSDAVRKAWVTRRKNKGG